MHLTRLSYLALIVFLGYSPCSFASPADFDKTPVMSVDFSHGVDLSVWQIANAPGNGGNKEEQYYIPEADLTDKNGLHIVARRQVTPVRWRPDNPYQYTAGKISTYQTFLYGRFEFVARLPKGTGFWPALWLVRWDKDAKAEIDVIEGFGGDSHAIQSTIHNWSNEGKNVAQQCAILGAQKAKQKKWCLDANNAVGNRPTDFTAGYHTFTLEWLPDHVTWFLDNKPYYTVTKDTPNVPIPAVPMGIIINFAMGGNWDGSVMADTSFPESFDVKSVKVWALKSPHS